MAKQTTVQRVEEIIRPYAEALGLTLWDVTFKKEGTDWYLRVFIDKEEGVSIDDCVDLTHAVSKPLDDADPIKQNYMLEISSPGVERELTREEHFARYLGAPVMLRTIRPVDGVRDFCGTLKDYKDRMITLTLKDGTEQSFDRKDTTYVKLDDFNIEDFI